MLFFDDENLRRNREDESLIFAGRDPRFESFGREGRRGFSSRPLRRIGGNDDLRTGFDGANPARELFRG